VLYSPFQFTGKIVRRITSAIWVYLGLLGLALRNLLTWIFWRPLLIIATPFRWFYTELLHRSLQFTWLSLRTFVIWFAVEVCLAAARAAPNLIFGKVSNVIHFLAAIFGWVKKQVSWWLPIFVRALRDFGESAARSPVRVNRLAIALLITLVIIALGVIPSSETQNEDSLTFNRALAEQRPPTSTPQPLPTQIPRPTIEPAVIPTVLAAETVLDTESIEANDISVEKQDPPIRSGAVSFTQRRLGNIDIYALLSDRELPLRLTSHPAEDRDPAWSPDGERLAFSSKRDGQWDIYILKIYEDQLVRLTADPAFDGGPSWSPDGRWIVYESYQNNNLDLYIVDGEGYDIPIRLTENPAHDFSPAWSPDGRHVAFTSWRSGQQDIYMLPLDGTSDEIALNITSSPGRSEDQPAFDLTGENLSYFADSDGFDLVYIHPVNELGSAGDPRVIGRGRYPSWSPDGESLVYVHHDEKRSYIVSSSIDAWNVAPQAYSTDAYVDDLSWSSVRLQQDLDLTKHPEAKNQLFFEYLSPIKQDGPPYLIWPVDVEVDSPYLSDRVDQSFEALSMRVIEEAGWDFLGELDNAFVALASQPAYGESFKNWNKTGRAFDFYYRFAISLDPQVEVVREDIGPNTYWRIFLRTAIQDGTQGEPIRQLPWDFNSRYGSDPQYYDQGGKIKDELPQGYYIDFTELASDYYWQRVPARQDWRTFFQGIRYWHFENRQGLSWEEAMLEIYTEDELARVFGNP